MTSLQVPCMQRIWKIKNSMLQLKIKRFADRKSSNSKAVNDALTLACEQEETDTKLLLCAQIPFDIGFERVNIVTVDTEMAILIIYFQSMFNEKIYHHYRTYSTCSYSCLTCLKIDWIKVLFKLCVVYVRLLVATQLAVLKEKIL